jgi:hypothetical protein
MKFVKMTLGVLLAFAMIGEASAFTTKIDNRGTLNYGDSGSIANLFGTPPSAFLDVVNFTLGGPSSISGVLFTTGISALFNLEDLDTGFSVATGSFSSGSYSFADLTSGKYRLSILGFTGRFGGYYNASYLVAAVPEAETWLMIIIGLGLVGFQLQRKQKSLRHQSLMAATQSV